MSSRFQIININTVTVINQETVYLRYKAIAIYIYTGSETTKTCTHFTKFTSFQLFNPTLLNFLLKK